MKQMGRCIKKLILPPLEPKTKNCFSTVSIDWFIRRITEKFWIKFMGFGDHFFLKKNLLICCMLGLFSSYYKICLVFACALC